MTAVPTSHPQIQESLPPVDRLRERLLALHPETSADTKHLDAAVFILAALRFGQNLEKLARYTRLSRADVSRHARRLLDNGIWHGGETHCTWSDPDNLDGSFWLDAEVATGGLCRRANPEVGTEWAPPGFWNKWSDASSQDITAAAVYADRSEGAPNGASSETTTSDQATDMPAPIKEGEAYADNSRVPVNRPTPLRDVPGGSGGAERTLDSELFPGASWLG